MGPSSARPRARVISVCNYAETMRLMGQSLSASPATAPTDEEVASLPSNLGMSVDNRAHAASDSAMSKDTDASGADESLDDAMSGDFIEALSSSSVATFSASEAASAQTSIHDPSFRGSHAAQYLADLGLGKSAEPAFHPEATKVSAPALITRADDDLFDYSSLLVPPRTAAADKAASGHAEAFDPDKFFSSGSQAQKLKNAFAFLASKGFGASEALPARRR